MGHDRLGQIFIKVKLCHCFWTARSCSESYERLPNRYHKCLIEVEVCVVYLESLPQCPISFAYLREETICEFFTTNIVSLSVEGFFFTNKTVLTAAYAGVVGIAA